jgi:putative inorganic carbon (hco3(-)) transporter
MIAFKITYNFMKIVQYCNKIIEYGFYSLFLLVPLVFSGATSELFEFNKMWLTFGVTAIIGAAWATKMVVEKKFAIRRTPLDIPIVLFLVSQILATLISMDPHVSWWGYYSRFNGGLLSTITYILLYYAFVTNFEVKQVMKVLKVSLIAGFITALWGFPAHFGADPTCLLFRGTLDTSCWTEAFQPTVRTFSTLGQPAWFAAYLALLIPIAMAFSLKQTSAKVWVFIALAVFFYVNLIFANTRAGFIAFWVANAIFWGVLYFRHLFPKQNFLRAFAFFNVAFLLCTFIFGTPISQINKFTVPGFTNQPVATEETTSGAAAPAPTVGGGITDSGVIRLFVWEGAINAWKSSPIIGTGVETFAFAYYKHKPIGHNMTSEWDFLYNKAHNEYLNYLTTTGLFGLGSYLAIIGLFLFITGKYFYKHFRSKAEHKHDGTITDAVISELLILALTTGFITILITNFLGFSVVIMNLYLFLIPVFVLMLGGLLKEKHAVTYSFGTVHESKKHQSLNGYQWTLITVFVFIAGWQIITLMTYHQADVAYALGSNLDKTGNFQPAYMQLKQAVETKPNEPVYKDELSINLAAISAGLYSQNDATNAAQLSKDAIKLSTDVVTNHPNNVVYWKNRVRLFYTLSATDQANAQQYLAEALRSINKAKELAPTDAKVAYNQGILYGQTGDLDRALSMLEETIKLKPDYRDAYVALGLFYHQSAVDENNKVTNPERLQKAIDTYQHILDKINPQDEEVKKSLDEWKQL